MIRKVHLGKAVVRTKKYNLYVATGDVYSKFNKYVTHVDRDIVDYIIDNPNEFKKYWGRKKVDKLIEQPETFVGSELDVTLDRMIDEIPIGQRFEE